MRDACARMCIVATSRCVCVRACARVRVQYTCLCLCDLHVPMLLCSGIAFSSSEEDDDCDSPFDGLHTQHALKLSHGDSYEDDDGEGIEPQGTVHHTSPSSLEERAAAYLSSSLGADSTTRQDLSNAGLEGDSESGRVGGWRVESGEWVASGRGGMGVQSCSDQRTLYLPAPSSPPPPPPNRVQPLAGGAAAG